MQVVWSTVVLAALLLYPLSIIFKRAGLNPYFSLLILIPYVGIFAVGVVLGAMQWGSGGRGEPS